MTPSNSPTFFSSSPTLRSRGSSAALGSAGFRRPSACFRHQYSKLRGTPSSLANALTFSPRFIRSSALSLKAAERRSHFRFALSDTLFPFR